MMQPSLKYHVKTKRQSEAWCSLIVMRDFGNAMSKVGFRCICRRQHIKKILLISKMDIGYFQFPELVS